MAETSNEETKKLKIDARELGNTGLKQWGGVVLEECNAELRYPMAVTTYKAMLKDSVIAPSVELIENKIASVEFSLSYPEGHDYLKEKTELLNQMFFNDMEHPFSTFIRQAATFNSFGFSVIEKVPRYRNYEYGSKYNDGYVGIRKLAFRSQDTIAKWKFDKGNKKLLGVYQYSNINNNIYSNDTFSGIGGGWNAIDSFSDTDLVYIPKEKFLHFVNNPYKDSPTGQSPLNFVHTAWKYKQAYLQIEAKGVSKEAHGIKTLYMPPEYMDEDASEELKAAYRMYKQIMMNLDLGDSSSIMLPILTDSMGNKMFELKVENLTGTSSYNIDNIIERFNNEIFTGLFANILPLGNKGGGSHALAEIKLDIVTDMVKSKLDHIVSVINHDLIPYIFKLNGWSLEVLPYIRYGDIQEDNLDDFSSAIQRIKAVGLLPKTVEIVNYILTRLGTAYRVPEGTTEEELDKLLGEVTSRSGDSFNTPTGGLNGTANTVSGEDNCVSNKEN